MIGRVAAVIYGMASYFVFFCSLLYAVGFIGNYLVPRSIDVGPESGLAQAIVINVVLLGLFAVQHSVMARPAFKRWWTTIVPASCERSTYVLISSLLLLLIFWQWRPIITTVWHVQGAPAILLTAICWIGWLIALTSSYLIDHFECSACARCLQRCVEPRCECCRSRRRASIKWCATPSCSASCSPSGRRRT